MSKIVETSDDRFIIHRSRSKNKKKNKKKDGKKTDEEEEEEEDDEPGPRQSVVHPSIIKEFLSRFPDYRPRLMILMVETALKDTINWKKRVSLDLFPRHSLLTLDFRTSSVEH